MVVYHNLFKDSEDLVDLLKYAKNIKEKEYFLSPWEDWGNLGEIMKNSFNSYFDEKNIFDPKFQKQKKIFDNIVKCYQIVAEDFFKEYKNTDMADICFIPATQRVTASPGCTMRSPAIAFAAFLLTFT